MKVHLWSVAVTATLSSALFIPTSQQALNDLDLNNIDGKDKASLDDYLFQLSLLDAASEIQNSDLDVTPTSIFDTVDAEDYDCDYLDDNNYGDTEYLPEDITELPPFSQLHSPHHPPSDKTIYELITESKYTTILAKLIKEDKELVHLLNSTEANHTFFAPTDDAFKKIPHHDDHKPPKELIRAVIKYYLVPGLWDARTVFHSHTLPTELESPALGDKLPQRLSVRAGWRGLTLNFYSRVVAPDIPGKNGLIHGISSVLIPPPTTKTLLDLVPTKFSTFDLALIKTNLTIPENKDKDTKKGHTIFAPSNTAFSKLGFKINAFLFSPYGQKYLLALLKYHIVPDRTLYSDVIYTEKGEIRPFGVKGFTHLDLPTLLGDRRLSVDVVRFGPYASLKVNGFQRVAVADVLGRDGNVHIVDEVLVPPKKVVEGAAEWDEWNEELTVEDLKERLAGWVEEDDHDYYGKGMESWTHGFDL
ncbi:FAS1 domain-containing protein [Aspergillus pseudotamarii]|uniref:FAS1 domain-containing protein n=1 Tax=Aspergillus pseudotamarii TaxID=132259 RepID=A0A5N6TC38_ASPPS|nr:FAS1 domain-containing protein [Aspergillus pseudotamarii]KAE8143944.1 FAS1 domain-containing protein [Aspergillus pseudotamarii]